MSSRHLPEEILIEILVKLPVKSIIRGSSVCKAWRGLIRSPSFISAHLISSNTRQNQAALLLRRYEYHYNREYYTVIPKRGGPLPAIKSCPEIEFPFKSQDRSPVLRIVGSCDGLVCWSDYAYLNPSPTAIIWNPAIRNHVVLPQPSIVNLTESHHYVLGFGVAGNAYKVVRLVYYNNRNPSVSMLLPEAEIFSLGSGTWRKLSAIDSRILQVKNMWSLKYMWDPIFFKGFMHWIGCNSMSANEYVDNNWIVTFHVGEEVFGEIMLPEELERKAGLMSSILAIMQGESLAAIDSGNHLSCIVWMMKEYGIKESWTKLYRIEIEGSQRVIGFWGNSEVLLALRRGHELVTYNAETKGIKHVEVSRYSEIISAFDYKESLLLLGGYNGDSQTLY